MRKGYYFWDWSMTAFIRTSLQKLCSSFTNSLASGHWRGGKCSPLSSESYFVSLLRLELSRCLTTLYLPYLGMLRSQSLFFDLSSFLGEALCFFVPALFMIEKR